MKMLMRKHGINYQFAIVEKITNNLYNKMKVFPYRKEYTKSDIGCLLSHMWCLKDIIDKGYKNAIILEDDIVFHKNFDKMFCDIMLKRPSYDVLLLGACDFSFSSTNYRNISNGLYQPKKNAKCVHGAHAIYYSLEGAKYVYEFRLNNITYFDYDRSSIYEHFKESAYICYPNLICCENSTSNLNHDYTFFSFFEKEYYGKCFVDFQYSDYNFIYLDIIEKGDSLFVNDGETYDSFMGRLIDNYFSRDIENYEKKRKIIKSRLVYDFFTISDIEEIMSQGGTN